MLQGFLDKVHRPVLPHPTPAVKPPLALGRARWTLLLPTSAR